jgi:hypothetical protein
MEYKMSDSKYGIVDYESSDERHTRQEFFEHYQQNPIPDDQVMSNLGLFLNSKSLSRILFMNHIYKQIIDVQGIVMEFGTRWGQNLSLFSALRGIYEPFNRHRKIVGFDTFTGFPSVVDNDGDSKMMQKGELAVTDNYEDYLSKILEFQEKDNPLSHIKKYDLRVGNAMIEIDSYLKECPETIVALAYFDFDIYEPTKKVLEAIKPRLVKGSVLGFDELNDPDSPGETLALMETIGLNNICLKRFPYTSRVSYFIVE